MPFPFPPPLQLALLTSTLEFWDRNYPKLPILGYDCAWHSLFSCSHAAAPLPMPFEYAPSTTECAVYVGIRSHHCSLLTTAEGRAER